MIFLQLIIQSASTTLFYLLKSFYLLLSEAYVLYMTYTTTHCFFHFTVDNADKYLLFTLDNFEPVFNNTFWTTIDKG